ncbi:MAG: hypothetical protein HGN29_15565 [Asgard group archaeon]|nr:hypothetical protein [Asgard group archaeon]
MTRLSIEEEKKANIKQFKERSFTLLTYMIFASIPLSPIFIIAYRQDNLYLWSFGLIIAIILSIPAIFILYRFLKSLISVMIDKFISE